MRDLEKLPDLEKALEVEKEVWQLDDADVTPLTFAVASKAAGSLWIGAFVEERLVGFAFALPSLEHGRIGFHSHLLAVREEYRKYGVGYQLKLEQRKRALGLGVSSITWTFDPLRALNAHLNFAKLGVIADSYRNDFYGAKTSSPLHSNGTDRLWVTWQLNDPRVEQRLKGKHTRPEVLDALAHLEPLVSFGGSGTPVGCDFEEALARQRAAIEIPGDISRIEHDQIVLAQQWREATRRAFSAAIARGFIVRDFCRSIRGQQGPGAYLLEKSDSGH